MCMIPARAPIARDLDVLGIVCGKAAMHRAASSRTFTAILFGKFRCPGLTANGNGASRLMIFQQWQISCGHVRDVLRLKHWRTICNGPTLRFLRGADRNELQA